MRKSNYQKVAAMIMLEMSLLVLDSCSIIGYHIGKSIDNRNNYVCYNVGKIKEGSKQTVYLENNTRIEGVFEGLDTMNTSQYRFQYESARQNSTDIPRLPGRGDTIAVKLKNGNTKSLEFEYFDYDWLTKESRGNENFQDYYLSGKISGTMILQRFYFNYIDNALFLGKNVVDGSSLLSYARRGDLPLKSAIILRNERGRNLIPLNQARQIKPGVKRNARWIGLTTGILLDIGVVAAVIAIGNALSGPWECTAEWPGEY